MTDFPNQEESNFHSMVRGRCPYLAVSIDRETWFKIPASENYCHKAKPPQPIRLSHQQLRCLSEYTLCPVYKYQKEHWKGQLPRELQGWLPEYISPKQPPVLLWAMIAAVVIAAIAILVFILTRSSDPAVPESATLLLRIM